MIGEMIRLGVGAPKELPRSRLLTDADGELFSVNYTDEERHAALLRIGPKRREFVERVVVSEAFANMPDQERAKALRKALQDASKEFYVRDARRQIARRHGVAMMRADSAFFSEHRSDVEARKP